MSQGREDGSLDLNGSNECGEKVRLGIYMEKRADRICFKEFKSSPRPLA